MGNPLANYPLTNYIFMLRVEAKYDLACSKISGIVQEKEYEHIQEGGVNDYVVLRRKPVSKPNILQVDRYVGENFFDPLVVGETLKKPLVLYVSNLLHRFNDNANLVFTFTGCTVMSSEYGALDAEKTGLMTVTTKIAYQTVAVTGSSISTTPVEQPL